MAQSRIVIADDEAFLTQILSAQLQRRGYEVFVADGGKAAFRLATERQPQLVIADLQMPDLDGMSLSVQLKENGSTSHIPVLMLTARGHLISAQDLARTNIRAVLPKPFSVRELFPKIEAAIAAPGEQTRIAV